MCARFSLNATPEQIARLLELPVEEVEPRVNIAPTDLVIGAIERGGERMLREFRWGLVPSWAKDIKIGVKMINARAETLAEKPAFKKALERRRCVIPASGFYEWKHTTIEEEVADDRVREGAPSLFDDFDIPRTPKKKPKVMKQPHLIGLKSGELFALAGLWEMWSDEQGNKLRTCTVVTTRPNEKVAELHDRMPVMLKQEQFELWLDWEHHGQEEIRPLLEPLPADEILIEPTSLV